MGDFIDLTISDGEEVTNGDDDQKRTPAASIASKVLRKSTKEIAVGNSVCEEDDEVAEGIWLAEVYVGGPARRGKRKTEGPTLSRTARSNESTMDSPLDTKRGQGDRAAKDQCSTGRKKLNCSTLVHRKVIGASRHDSRKRRRVEVHSPAIQVACGTKTQAKGLLQQRKRQRKEYVTPATTEKITSRVGASQAVTSGDYGDAAKEFHSIFPNFDKKTRNTGAASSKRCKVSANSAPQFRLASSKKAKHTLQDESFTPKPNITATKKAVVGEETGKCKMTPYTVVFPDFDEPGTAGLAYKEGTKKAKATNEAAEHTDNKLAAARKTTSANRKTIAVAKGTSTTAATAQKTTVTRRTKTTEKGQATAALSNCQMNAKLNQFKTSKEFSTSFLGGLIEPVVGYEDVPVGVDICVDVVDLCGFEIQETPASHLFTTESKASENENEEDLYGAFFAKFQGRDHECQRPTAISAKRHEKLVLSKSHDNRNLRSALAPRYERSPSERWDEAKLLDQTSDRQSLHDGKRHTGEESVPVKGTGIALPSKASVPATVDLTTDQIPATLPNKTGAAVVGPIGGTGIMLPAKAAVFSERKATTNPSSNKATGRAQPLEALVLSRVDSSTQNGAAVKVVPHAYTPLKGMTDTNKKDLWESPLGVNNCVGVVDLFCDKGEHGVLPVATAHCEFAAKGQTSVKSQSARKILVSEDAADENEVKGNSKLPPPVTFAPIIHPSARNPKHRQRRKRKSSSQPWFRPQKRVTQATKIGEPEKQRASNKESTTTSLSSSADVRPHPCTHFIFVDSGGGDESEDDYRHITQVKPRRKTTQEICTKARAISGKPSLPVRQHGGDKMSRRHRCAQQNETVNLGKADTHCTHGTQSILRLAGFASEEAAAELQNRLLNESAKRVRQRVEEDPSFYKPVPADELLSFAVPFLDVYKKYPHHWQWSDPYARLGLPRNATGTQVKKHYRKLALIYHPDKLKAGDSTEQFHAITAAYRKLQG